MDAELTSIAARAASQPISPAARRQRQGGKSGSGGAAAAAASPAFLSDLGKATLRGIRKCPRCGVYNGTRGLSCKNKACGVALRDGSAGERGGGGGGKKRVVVDVEAVRVVLDAGGRDGGVASGGQERIEEGGVAAAGEEEGGVAAGPQVYSVCQKGRGAAAAQVGFVELTTDTAVTTGDGATLLTRVNLGRCFLPSCRQRGQRSNADPSARLMADDDGAAPPGPDADAAVCVHVRRAMACQSRASPLTLKSSVLEGLLAPAEVRDELWRLATETPGPLVQRVAADRLVVKCHSDANHPLGLLHLTIGAGAAAAAAAAAASSNGSNAAGKGAPGSERCLHFYACVCAFASDDQLASDFAAFINYSHKGVLQKVNNRSHCGPGKPLQQHQEPISSHHNKQKRLRPDDPLGTSQVVDEHTVAMGFHQWLASVTERIHQTMHYQFDGRPEPLIYHIPQDFFQALQHRLSLGSKKRRLPNATTAFVRNDLPLGPFSKYTWQITNLTQLRQIFDTPELPLEFTQSFVRNIDGSFSPFRCPHPPSESEAVAVGYRTDKPQVIRPLELRTFLKVGTWAVDQKEPTPFVIEWTPDVLPRSRVGELRIGFEFGHQQSGQSDHGGACEGGGAQRAVGGAGPNKSAAEHVRSQTLEILQVVA
ncbi:unnamed protein product [Merluccius merluccius]